MRLWIDPTPPDDVLLALLPRGGAFTNTVRRSMRDPRQLLTAIDQLLRRHHIRPHQVTAITVVTGPGRFSRLRVAAVIANIFAEQYRIPLFATRKGRNGALLRPQRVAHVAPHYGAPPSITTPRRGSGTVPHRT